MNIKKIIIAVFILFRMLDLAAVEAHHPEIRWREISNRQFIVVYPGGYEADAIYTLRMAQELNERLETEWKGVYRIRGKIRILLTDSYDESNGSATFFPYNHIKILLYTPQPDMTIGSGRDWIRLVLSHELKHIIDYNAGSGFTYWLRKLFGNNPVFFPAAVMPNWIMEGMAVYFESQMEPGGRLNSPDYRAMLSPISMAGRVPDWTQIWGAPTSWPGGTSIYLYGAAFTAFLVDTYGPEKIPEFVSSFASRPIPIKIKKGGKPVILTINKRFKEVFGRNLDELWEQFRKSLKKYPAENAESNTERSSGTKGKKSSRSGSGYVTYLTRSGKYKKYPQQSSDGTVYYVNRNYVDYPGIYRLDRETGREHRIIKKSGINGMYYSESEQRIYFSATDYYKSFYRYSDLYRLDPGNGKVKRLSRGKRLQYPAKGRSLADTLYCVKRIKTQSYLAAFDLKTGKERILSEGFNSLANLAVSPDGKSIAAAVKRENKNWTIGVFNSEGRLEMLLAEEYGKSFNPVWRGSGELYFVLEYTNCYRLAFCRVKDHDKGIYVAVGEEIPDIRFIANLNNSTSSAGGGLTASFFGADGYNLGRIEVTALANAMTRIEPAISQVPKPGGREEAAKALLNSTIPGSKPYNAARELLPQYISGTYRSGGDEYQPGLLLSGNDLINRHSYVLNAYYGIKSNSLNLDLSYTFRGLYPALTLRYTDLSDYNRSTGYGNIIRNERELQLICLYPLWNRSRNQASLYTDVHFETVTDDYRDYSHKMRNKLNGIRLGFFFNSAKRYYDSISLADGVRLSLSYSREYRFLGSSYNIDTAAFQYRQYISLYRPNVLALRLGVTDSRGEAGRVFYMGGAEGSIGYHLAGNDIFELMRGYPSGYFAGTGGWLANLEYRASLLKIEHVFLMFRSIERLYLTLFTDIGNMWTKKIVIDPSYSFGLELNLTAYLGDFKFTFSAGAAIGHQPYRKPVIYFRIGNTF
jgi:hypothetical protein